MCCQWMLVAVEVVNGRLAWWWEGWWCLVSGSVHLVHFDLGTCAVGRRIGLVCDLVGAIDLGGLVCDPVVAIDLAMVGGIDQPLFDGLLNQEGVLWPIQGWHVASLVASLVVWDQVAMWLAATFEPLLPGVRAAGMRLLEELLLLMPW